jgi:putative DNA primase/helicase
MNEETYYEQQLKILNEESDLSKKREILEGIDYSNKIEKDSDAELIRDFKIFLEGIKSGVLKEPKQEGDIKDYKKEILSLIALRQEDLATEKAVECIKQTHYFNSIKQDKISEIWVYENGIRKPNGEAVIKELCRNLFEKSYTPQRANKVIAKIEADSFIEADEFFKKEGENLLEIATPNGILDLKTKELKPFSPNKYFFSKINAVYNPEAKCPKIKQFLREILRDEESVNVAFELIGFLLFRKYFIQVAFMLLGDGENAKGVFGSLVRRFIGETNLCSIALNQLTGDSFSCEGLFGKLGNFSGDISNSDLKDTGMFKQLCSGTDLITAHRKFKRDLIFMNYSKLIFSCNELPKVYDFSYGFWRRWLILEFPYTFLKESEYELRKNEPNIKKANPLIIDEITTEEELSGLLNEALLGLERLLKNKQFSYSKSTSQVKELWIRKSDSFMAFCMDNLEQDYSNTISKKELRRKFNEYCKFHKIKGTSDISIKITLQNQFGATESRKGYPEQEFIWEGIKFKEYSQGSQGFLPYNEINNSPLGVKSIDTLTIQEIPLELQGEQEI